MMKNFFSIIFPLAVITFSLSTFSCAGNANFPKRDAWSWGPEYYDAARVIDSSKAADQNIDGPKIDAGLRKDLLLLDGARKIDQTKIFDQGQAPSGVPCATTFKSYPYNSQMAVCYNSSANLNQCQANQACNEAGGWKVCTASQFLANGGDTMNRPSNTDYVWIKGCVRYSSTSLDYPDDNTCPCTDSTGQSSIVGFDCNSSNSYSLSKHNFGVVASGNCYRLGSSLSTAKRGYWDVRPASYYLEGAVCCQ